VMSTRISPFLPAMVASAQMRIRIRRFVMRTLPMCSSGTTPLEGHRDLR
jgi:hypothetical protein